MKKKLLILGAGISGLTLGWKMVQRGVPAIILEAESYVGGLAATIRHHSCYIDFGPHSFFTDDEEVKNLVFQLFNHQNELQESFRNAKFLFRNRLLDYPFTPKAVLAQMGIVSTLTMVLDFLKIKFTSNRYPTPDVGDQSVQDWALASFGKHLYENFFKPYTEQFWKISCSELSARAIPSYTRLGFKNALRAIFGKSLKKELFSQIDRERLPTYYPKGGYGEIASRIEKKFLKEGGELYLSSRVVSVDVLPDGNKKVIFVKDGKRYEEYCETVVSTLPLPLFISILAPATEQETVIQAAQNLDFRPLLVMAMVTERKNVLGADYIYTLDRPYNRIMETSKFSPADVADFENIIAVEIPSLRSCPEWSASREELFDRCIKSLEFDGILERNEVRDYFLLKASYAYPIYRKGFEQSVRFLRDYLDSIPGVYTLGRGGEFLYMDADQCIRRALDLSEKLHNYFIQDANRDNYAGYSDR